MLGSSADQKPDAVHTVLSVLRGAETWLQGRGVEAPKRSAELLLGSVLGMSKLELYLNHDRPLDAHERDLLRELVARRGQGEPVAYLMGSWSFRGLDLAVNPAVLIPRPETEELVEAVLARTPPGAELVDLGTGSGAIAVALAVERPDVRVLATDLSKNALAVARANAQRHGVQDRIEFALGSWWQAVPAARQFDLVVSNPPYIDPNAPIGFFAVSASVKAHEPPLALFSAPGDVLSCYRTIVAGLDAYLRPGGWFVAETGVGASEASSALLRSQPFLTDVHLEQDLAGIDRILLARRSST